MEKKIGKIYKNKNVPQFLISDIDGPGRLGSAGPDIHRAGLALTAK